ncbi:AraC family transcriptional regulator [Ruminococcaceae bacterium OttesenSCG-928-L11]|nr:AraC family transcriptional regulator [Ruminococcaceae bacterium OttesenSCG-928-L11]
MKWLSAKNKNSFYILLRRSLLALIVVIILLCTIPFYHRSREITLDKFKEADITAITQTMTSTAAMHRIAYSITNQVFNDLNIAWLLYGREYDPVQLSISMTQLQNYRASIPYIDSIYIYNGLTNTMAVSSSYNGAYDVPVTTELGGFFDTDIVSVVKGEGGPKSRFMPMPRRLVVNRYGREEELLLYTFIRTNVYGDTNYDSAIFINFSYSWMEQMMPAGDNGDSVLIVDAAGTVVSDSPRYKLGTDVSGQEFYRRISEDPTGTSTFILDIDGEKTIVSYIPPDANGWRYMRLAPYHVMMQGFNAISRFTAIVIAILVVFGIGIAYILSRMLYVPVGKVHDEVLTLEEQNRRIQRLSRLHVLRNLLTGPGSTAASLEKALPDLKLKIGSDVQYRIVLIKIDNYSKFISDTGPTGVGLVRYGITNIALEICSDAFRTEAADMGDDGIAILLSSDTGFDWNQSDWEAFLQPLSQGVEGAYSLSISFVVGGECADISELPTAFRRVKEAAFHRVFYGTGAVILAEDFMHFPGREYVYPTAKEDAMVEAVTGGNGEKAKEIMRSILFETAEYPYPVVNLAVAKIALSLNLIIRELQKGNFLELSGEISDRILYATTLNEETIPNFCRAIDEIAENVEDKRSSRHTELLQRINHMIETDFQNPDCSVETIAQEIGMSSAHIGRLYKRYTLKSISESISAVRMEYARTLLREKRSLSVASISEKAGFASSSYFSKAFRKEHGMTPNEYRNSAVSEEA